MELLTLASKITRPPYISDNLILMGRNLESVEVCGKRIVNVMGIYSKECSSTVNEMVLEDIFSKMETIILGSLKKIIMKEWVSL